MRARPHYPFTVRILQKRFNKLTPEDVERNWIRYLVRKGFGLQNRNDTGGSSHSRKRFEYLDHRRAAGNLHIRRYARYRYALVRYASGNLMLWDYRNQADLTETLNVLEITRRQILKTFASRKEGILWKRKMLEEIAKKAARARWDKKRKPTET